MLLPTLQIPELEGKSEEEIKDILAIYIMQFGNLNYQITLKALNNITLDEDKMAKFCKAPIPTLARESVKLTEFTKQEKENYKLSQQLEYAVDTRKRTMIAYTASRPHQRVPDGDRPMTQIEEDFYIHYRMTREEYVYWVNKERGKEIEKPEFMRYNPKTRCNDYKEIYA